MNNYLKILSRYFNDFAQVSRLSEIWDSRISIFLAIHFRSSRIPVSVYKLETRSISRVSGTISFTDSFTISMFIPVYIVNLSSSTELKDHSRFWPLFITDSHHQFVLSLYRVEKSKKGWSFQDIYTLNIVGMIFQE